MSSEAGEAVRQNSRSAILRDGLLSSIVLIRLL
jgi:hypothetical protein